MTSHCTKMKHEMAVLVSLFVMSFKAKVCVVVIGSITRMCSYTRLSNHRSASASNHDTSQTTKNNYSAAHHWGRLKCFGITFEDL